MLPRFRRARRRGINRRFCGIGPSMSLLYQLAAHIATTVRFPEIVTECPGRVASAIMAPAAAPIRPPATAPPTDRVARPPIKAPEPPPINARQRRDPTARSRTRRASRPSRPRPIAYACALSGVLKIAAGKCAKLPKSCVDIDQQRFIAIETIIALGQGASVSFPEQSRRLELPGVRKALDLQPAARR
jgi:hypothetical protein